MKKYLAIILALVMAVMAFAACGKKNEPASPSDASGEEEAAASNTDLTEISDAAYVTQKGKLVVGITDFAPMDYKDESGEWVGFDADLAKEFAKKLGVEVEFAEIEWANKVMELDAKVIDCVWNGMTLTDEVKSAMSCTEAYCNNAQVAIVPADKAADLQTAESLKGLKIAVEGGSAGEAVATELGLTTTPVTAQADAIMEVAAGTSDAAIIDSLMAAAMVGEGTSYDKLTYTVALNSEEYGVGFRQGSDLTGMLNAFFADAYADGTISALAEKYGVTAAIIAK